MKFFVPLVKNKKQEKSVYASIKKFISQNEKIDILNTRIYKIFFEHDTKKYITTVGKNTNFNNELVIAILETTNLYFVCTPNRGVRKGNPILVSKNISTQTILFDEE